VKVLLSRTFLVWILGLGALVLFDFTISGFTHLKYLWDLLYVYSILSGISAGVFLILSLYLFKAHKHTVSVTAAILYVMVVFAFFSFPYFFGRPMASAQKHVVQPFHNFTLHNGKAVDGGIW